MEKGSTKQQILDAALELFSMRGFEATSIAQIAEAVGIRKASLYSHFAGKQDILDALVAQILSRYRRKSVFAGTDWNDPNVAGSRPGLTPGEVVDMVRGQILYILHDPQVSKARKLLVIEQFQNPELAALQTKQNYEDVLRYHIGLMKFLIRQGVLVGDDPEIMAAQFCLPISVWINLCDREPEREEEILALIERHILQFFRAYQSEGKKE